MNRCNHWLTGKNCKHGTLENRWLCYFDPASPQSISLDTNVISLNAIQQRPLFPISELTTKLAIRYQLQQIRVSASTQTGIFFFIQHPASDLRLPGNLLLIQEKLLFSVIIVPAGIVFQVKGCHGSVKPLNFYYCFGELES